MNYNKKIEHLWPYAYRGRITLTIENTTIEDFEQIIYHNLRRSIAKIIRNFCLKNKKKCLSEDADSIR